MCANWREIEIEIELFLVRGKIKSAVSGKAWADRDGEIEEVSAVTG